MDKDYDLTRLATAPAPTPDQSTYHTTQGLFGATHPSAEARPPAPFSINLASEQMEEFAVDQLAALLNFMCYRAVTALWRGSYPPGRHATYIQGKCSGSHLSPLFTLVGKSAWTWIDVYELEAINAGIELYGEPHPNFGNKSFQGGEGKGRVPKWRETVYFLERAAPGERNVPNAA